MQGLAGTGYDKNYNFNYKCVVLPRLWDQPIQVKHWGSGEGGYGVAMVRGIFVILVGLVMASCAPLRALFSPTSVVTEAVGRTAAQATNALESASQQQTLSDIDRIMAEHSGAENIDELRRLKGDLEENPLAVDTPKTTAVEQRPPPDEFDRRSRLAAESEQIRMPSTGRTVYHDPANTKGDAIVRGDHDMRSHRGEGNGFAASAVHDIPPAQPRIFAMDFDKPSMARETTRRDE